MYNVCIINVVDVFEPFLKAYVEEFKFRSVTTDDWKQFLYKYFDDKVNSSVYLNIFQLFWAVVERNIEIGGM